MSEPERPRLSAGIRMSMEGRRRWIDCYNAARPHSALGARRSALGARRHNLERGRTRPIGPDRTGGITRT
ncbi:protein of unknown function [Azospirillum lipoferum 4B]|uniref:Uncharacterized protein n=1 Tax=Azospirillum lipoferum (strain 4B) TaxID=862719 RepID=G7Z6E3_AZOL4|nr:protein of unknown function [Azospirillum lipoferum 4B]